MGHNDISVTLNTYTSVLNKFKNDELQKLNDYYLTNMSEAKTKTLDER